MNDKLEVSESPLFDQHSGVSNTCPEDSMNADSIVDTRQYYGAKPRHQESLSLQEEITMILCAAHATTRTQFIDAVETLLTPEEHGLIKQAEEMSLYVQACHILDDVMRRLTLRFADLIGWPRSAIAEVVRPRVNINNLFDCVVLDLTSRHLSGHVAFRISEPSQVSHRFPQAALKALAETSHYWTRVVYLEPLLDMQNGGKILRSISQVRRVHSRPRDPIICSYLGAGPKNYGYGLGKSFADRKGKRPPKNYRDLVFLVAHWD